MIPSDGFLDALRCCADSASSCQLIAEADRLVDTRCDDG